MTKAPPGRKATNANPADRGKRAAKRHMRSEGAGLPISVVLTGANRHDKTQLEGVLDAMPVLPPLPTQEDPQHFWGTKDRTILMSEAGSVLKDTPNTSVPEEKKLDN